MESHVGQWAVVPDFHGHRGNKSLRDAPSFSVTNKSRGTKSSE